MANLGNLFFSIGLKDMTDSDWDKIVKNIERKGAKLGLTVDANNLHQQISQALATKKYEIDLSVAVKDNQVEAAIRNAYNRVANMGGVTTQTKKSSEAQLIRADAYARSQAALERNRNALAALREARLRDAEAARQQRAADEALGKSMNQTRSIVGGLRNEIANVYSIYTLRSFLNSLIQIGGEFQKQHIALQTMLGDVAKADEIFSQMKQLAVESPFNFQNLTGWAKQLTAYSVPYEELYETTKRLADISAGLGIDMNRIILAYGQVRSAAFLRGTELRQFTEAGIPLLDQLAKKFTELEGRVVSVGEVFDKISAREVPFQMVKDVLWDLTNEGGQFFQMQEVLTESLSGKWDKLKDSYQIMIGEIAQGSNDIIGGGLDMLTELTSHWNEFLKILYSVIAGWGAYKTVIALVNAVDAIKIARTIGFTNALNANTIASIANARAQNGAAAGGLKLLNTTSKLKTALTGIGSVAGGWSLVITALAAIGTYAYSAYQEANRLRKELEEIDTKAVGSIEELSYRYQHLVTELGNAKEGTKEYADIIQRINSGYGQYLDHLFKESEAYENVAKSIDKVTKAIVNKVQNQAYEQKVSSITGNYTDKLASIQEDMADRIADVYDVDDKLANTMAQHVADLIKQGESYQDAMKIVAEELKKSYKTLEKIETFSGDPQGMSGSNIIRSNVSKEYEDTYKEFQRMLEEASTSFSGYIPYSKELDEIKKKWDEINKSAKSENEVRLNTIKMYQEQLDFLTKRGVSDRTDIFSSIQQKLAALKKPMEEWIKNATEVFDTAVEINGQKFNVSSLAPQESEFSNIISYYERLVKWYKEAQTELEKLNKVPMPARNDNWFNNFGMLSAGTKQAEASFEANGMDINDWLNAKATGTGSSKDTVAEMWKERLSLMKEAESEYKKWSELVGKEEAVAKLTRSGMFGELGENFDFANARDEIRKFVEEISKSASTDEQRNVSEEGLKIVLGFAYDENKDALDKALKDVEKYIGETTKRWNLFKKAQGATGSLDFAMNLAFGGTVNVGNQIEELQERIKKELEGTTFTLGDVLGMDEDRLKENGLSALVPLVNAYRKTTEKMDADTSENLLGLIEKYKDYASRITDIERNLQKDISDIEKNRGKLGDDATNRLIEQRKKTAEEGKGAVMWEQFKDENDWGQVFEDLDRVGTSTLRHLMDGMERFAGNTGMSVEDTKELMDALGKMRKEVIERNPLQGFLNAVDELKKWRFADERLGDKDSFTFKRDEGGFSKGQTVTRAQVDSGLQAAYDDEMKSIDSVCEKLNALADGISMVSSLFEALGNESLSNFGDVISGSIGGAASMGSAVTAIFGESAGPWGAAIGAGVGLLTSVFQIHDKKLQKQIEESENTVRELQSVYDEVDRVLERTLGNGHSIKLIDAERDKQELKSLQAEIARIQNGVASFHDILNLKEYQKEAEKLQKRADAYEEGGAYSYQRQLLEEQYAELEKQRDLELDKKNTDDSKVSDLEDQMAELRDQITYMAQDVASELYSIDLKGWAQELGDALFDAWKSGEDGAEAFRQKAGELIGQVMNDILRLQILEPAMQDISDYLFGTDEERAANGGKGGVFGTDFELDEGELKGLADRLMGMADVSDEYTSMMDQLNEYLKQYGVDIKEDADSANKGLTGEIKGVTEDTAGLLASYLNAIRQDVSVERRLMEKITEDGFKQVNVIAQAQLIQLQAIADNTGRNAQAADDIYALLRQISNGSKTFSIK